MSVFCIISEFNPLHNGHKYLIDQARAMGAEAVVCVMSGNATQRGELAVVDKYCRAEAAVRSGADLVLELPYPWCASSAEYFGTAGVCIAGSFGDKLIFGSECGSIEKLQRAAELCETEDFSEEYRRLTADGMGAARAFETCLADRGVTELSSNDLLGIAYIRAIHRLDVAMTPVTVKREGGGYNQRETVEGALQSATAMREYIKRGDIEGMAEYVPQPMLRILKEEYAEGRIADIEQISSLVLGYYRLADAEELDCIADMTGGLSSRFITAARQSTTVSQMLERLSTKRYTDAKLRRALLFGLTGARRELIASLPEYTVLLAATKKGRELLAKNRKTEGIRVVTKPADTPRESGQFRQSSRLEDIYCMAKSSPSSAEEAFRRGAFVEK